MRRATGKVYLVGAGPGDPGLLTLRGADVLSLGDLVIYDRLVPAALLERAQPGADLVYMGKAPGEGADVQSLINRALIDAALSGKTAVRLKGGDPFVFGRGGEEVQALADAGVPYEVVPGVTSAIAAPAYGGIPVTHRGVAASFTVVSGSEDSSLPEPRVDWDALAKVHGTLVVLMGARNLAEIAGALVAGGKPADTPAAVIEWGTTPRQRSVAATLGAIAQRAADAGLSAPAVAVIGDVARFHETFRWFRAGPLTGARVLVTRSRPQASRLSALLIEAGAEPVEVATIAIEPLNDYAALDGALARLHSYDWVVLTSANGAEALFDRLAVAARDARAFGDAKVAAIGPATALALRRYGVLADFIPDVYTTERVAESFTRLRLSGKAMLLAQADIAPKELADGLRAQGAMVDDVPAYRTVAPPDAGERAKAALASGTISIATFTSSSTVRNLAGLLRDDARLLHGVTIATIGPATTAAARECGLRVDIEAEEHTVEGLVDALVRAAQQGKETVE